MWTEIDLVDEMQAMCFLIDTVSSTVALNHSLHNSTHRIAPDLVFFDSIVGFNTAISSA